MHHWAGNNSPRTLQLGRLEGGDASQAPNGSGAERRATMPNRRSRTAGAQRVRSNDWLGGRPQTPPSRLGQGNHLHFMKRKHHCLSRCEVPSRLCTSSNSASDERRSPRNFTIVHMQTEGCQIVDLAIDEAKAKCLCGSRLKQFDKLRDVHVLALPPNGSGAERRATIGDPRSGPKAPNASARATG